MDDKRIKKDKDPPKARRRTNQNQIPLSHYFLRNTATRESIAKASPIASSANVSIVSDTNCLANAITVLAKAQLSPPAKDSKAKTNVIDLQPAATDTVGEQTVVDDNIVTTLSQTALVRGGMAADLVQQPALMERVANVSSELTSSLAVLVQQPAPMEYVANVSSELTSSLVPQPTRDGRASTSSDIPVPDFWSELDRRLDKRFTAQTQSITEVVKTQIALQLQGINNKVQTLDLKIDREVLQLRTEIQAVVLHGPTIQEFDLLKARVFELESKELTAEARIKLLEETSADALTRTESLENHVSLVTEVAVGLIDHARGMSDHITDIEGRMRRGNLRIYGVEEGAETGSSVSSMVEDMVKQHLGIDDFEIERAHRAAGAPSPPGQTPRSIVVMFTKEKDQEKILKKAWGLKGFLFRGKKIGFGRDNASAVQDKINSFRATKKRLQELHISHRTGQWGQLVVSYSEPSAETETYWSPYEAYLGMSKRSIVVSKVNPPIDLAEELQKDGWAFQGQERATRDAFKDFVGGCGLGRSRGSGTSHRRSRQPR